MRSQFSVILAFIGLIGVHAIPFLDKDLIWFPTEDGRFLPAFLKEREPRPIKAIEDDVQFWHYLPGEEEGREVTLNCTGCLTNFANNAPLVVAAHGFGSGGHNGRFGQNVRAGFANFTGPVNMILIDFDKLSQNPDYGTAVRNIQPVGEYTAKLINYLVEEGVATLNDTHFVGHSLGAHVPNYISPNLVGGKMRTVFALDAAWPLFEARNDSHRLDPEDAQFVNVMHTSTVYMGFKNPTGHVDFYPNSGRDQPGCDDNIFGHCSHAICHDFFRESVTSPEAFSSCKCSSWAEFDDGSCACQERIVMGWHTPPTARGVFYLRTNPEPPYGL